MVYNTNVSWKTKFIAIDNREKCITTSLFRLCPFEILESVVVSASLKHSIHVYWFDNQEFFIFVIKYLELCLYQLSTM
jgi:hypothetical protein